jgi:hypothetical protein
MELKDAVRTAKRLIVEIFEEEKIDEIGLEEVEYDDQSDTWHVTIGFRRPWSRSGTPAGPLVGMFPGVHERWYKLVAIRGADGALLSVKDRILKEAA